MITATKAQHDRYLRAAHAVQAGTKMTETSAMDCRIGLNVALAEMGGFVELLIAKGLFTEAEYVEAITKGVEREKARLEQELFEKTGAKITLV